MFVAHQQASTSWKKLIYKALYLVQVFYSQSIFELEVGELPNKESIIVFYLSFIQPSSFFQREYTEISGTHDGTCSRTATIKYV